MGGREELEKVRTRGLLAREEDIGLSEVLAQVLASFPLCNQVAATT